MSSVEPALEPARVDDEPATRVAGVAAAVGRALPALVLAAIVVGNAWAGLMPGVGFWDTGEFQAVLPTLGTAHAPGFPTYVLLGFVGQALLAPLGEAAFRVTVLSLAFVAIAAVTTMALVRRLTGWLAIGFAAGLGLALTPVVWLNATRADPHPLHLAFVTLLLLALVRWQQDRKRLDPDAADRRLLLAAILFGLAAGNHSLTLLLAPAIALFVVAVEPRILRRPGFVLGAIGVAVATLALVYLELPIRAGLVRAPIVYGRPETWDGFWYIALAQQFQGSLGNPFADLPGKLDTIAGLATQQLGPLLLLVPFAFVVTLRRAPAFALLTGVAMATTLLFNTSYQNADITRYYLGPVLWAWLWLAVLGGEVANLVASAAVRDDGRFRGLLARLARRPDPDPRRWDRIGAAASILVAVALLVPAVPDLEDRRADADRSGDTAAARWLDEALPVLPRGAVVVSWWSTSTPLWYAQHVRGQRTDLFIVDDRTMLDLELGRAPDVIERYLGRRPVFVIRANDRDLNELLARFEMTRVAGDGGTAVYEVLGRLEPGG